MVEAIAGRPLERAPSGEPTGELIREVLEETSHLVRLEIALARVEVRDEIAQAKAGGIVLGVAAMAGISALTMFMVAIALAFAASWLAALVIAGVLLLLAATAAIAGWKAMPKQPMGATRSRLESDYEQLKERVA